MNEQLLNKVIYGDCLEEMKDIEDKSVDMILCDLPYGTTKNKWDSIIPLDKLWEQYERIIKDNGAIVLFAIEPFATSLRASNLDKYKHEWIWNKEVGGNFIQAKNHPLRVHENVLVFSKGKVNYYPQMTDADIKKNRPVREVKQKVGNYGKVSQGVYKTSKDYNSKKRYPKSIITYNGRSKECNNSKRLHPTQKPVDLGRYLIRTYTNEGETILDNTCGSGSFLVAALLENRNFIGIEKEWEYCEIANKRIEEAKLNK